jgi:hypothetical protein
MERLMGSNSISHISSRPPLFDPASVAVVGLDRSGVSGRQVGVSPVVSDVVNRNEDGQGSRN